MDHPRAIAMAIAAQVGELRRKYTAIDPRVIGFASMQFHYTGQLPAPRTSPLPNEKP
jgi:hypothetical protein